MSGPFESAVARAWADGKHKPLELARVIREVFETPAYAKREAEVKPKPLLLTQPETLEQRARALADAWEADNGSVDPDALSPELRAAVREELQARRGST